MFEESIRILTRDEESLAHKILNKVETSVKFEESLFIKFLFNYLVSIRSKMYDSNQLDSESIYTCTQNLTMLIREIKSPQKSGDEAQDKANKNSEFWTKIINDEIKKALSTF